jgi:hypothetical protein
LKTTYKLTIKIYSNCLILAKHIFHAYVKVRRFRETNTNITSQQQQLHAKASHSAQQAIGWRKKEKEHEFSVHNSQEPLKKKLDFLILKKKSENAEVRDDCCIQPYNVVE